MGVFYGVLLVRDAGWVLVVCGGAGGGVVAGQDLCDYGVTLLDLLLVGVDTVVVPGGPCGVRGGTV